MGVLQGIGEGGEQWLDIVGCNSFARGKLFENINTFNVFNYKVSQVLLAAWFRNDAKIVYLSNVAALEFFELFGVRKKGLAGCFRGEREREDFKDDVSFFALFIFAQVG